MTPPEFKAVGITVFSATIIKSSTSGIRGDKLVFNLKVSDLAQLASWARCVTHRMPTKKTQHPLLALSVIPAYLGVAGAVNPYI